MSFLMYSNGGVVLLCTYYNG